MKIGQTSTVMCTAWCETGGLTSTKAGAFSAEGFRDHVATDGSLLGVAGKWSACGWSVVQLDHDDEGMGPMHGMYGTLEAVLQVQRTTKRANNGIIDGLWKREVKCIGPKAKRRRFVDRDLGGRIE